MDESSHPLDMSSKEVGVDHHSESYLHKSYSPKQDLFPLAHLQYPPSSPPGISPPPLTKIVKKPPSTPREFFAKLYEPDTPKQASSPPQVSESFSLNFSHQVPSFHLPSYFPAFPIPQQEVGTINLKNIPFPAGLAAFCKYIPLYVIDPEKQEL